MYVDGGQVKKSFFKKDDIVFKEGDEGIAAYIVETGSVGIFKTVEGEEIQLATIKEGELFGEMAIIDGSKRMARAVALVDTVIVAIPRAGFESLLTKQPPFVKTLIHILADNLRNVHEKYMKRPRSYDDFLNAVAFNLGSFHEFLKCHPDADQTGEALRRVHEVEDQIARLRELMAGHKDRRTSVMDASGPAAPIK
jgi:CRP-like cAMP-binding protein